MSVSLEVFIVEMVTNISCFCLPFLKFQMPVQYLSTPLASQLLYRRAQVDRAEPEKNHPSAGTRNEAWAMCLLLLSLLLQTYLHQWLILVWQTMNRFQWRHRKELKETKDWCTFSMAVSKFTSQGQRLILSLILLRFLLHLESNARDSGGKAFCLNL